ncbi:hypothetical protein GGS20DRAFT_527909 [Poronia punctata]|nr:hypothetical protein GGS20DRAFT_527909 [Poronia punctata]
MADFSRTSTDRPSPSHPDYDQPVTMSPGNVPSPALDNGVSGPTDSPRVEPGDGAVEAGPAVPAHGAKPDDAPQRVQDVLGSDIGISTLLNRLKQSIASAKEFAIFLKKRSTLEEDHAKGLKKLCRSIQDSIHHIDHRQGSFAKAYEEMLAIHDRMAENGTQFALSLHQMHEDLIEVVVVAEKHRKGWKQNGLSAEQRLVDLETAMRKSKTKYDSLAEEYDRVRTGEARQGPRVFGIKGPKSAAQQEEDLLRKTQAADTDYMGKVQAYQAEKALMESTTRPEAIKALQDLIRECDSGTTLQMQKFASFNEKLLLNNGLVVSPLKHVPSEHQRSLKEVIHAIDNTKDLEDYVSSFHSKLPATTSEPKYERHPVLNPPQSITQSHMANTHQQPARPQSQQQNLSQSLPPLQTQMPPHGSLGRAGTYDIASSAAQGSPGQTFIPPSLPAAQRSTTGLNHERSYSHGAMLTQPSMQPQPQQSHNPRNSTQGFPPQARFNGSVNSPLSNQSGPPQLGALPFQSHQPRAQSPQQGSNNNTFGRASPQQESSSRTASPPKMFSSPTTSGKQVFGLSLARLYERDQFAVPMVVHQCIQAVDLYGLAVEGIYRLSGSATHVNKLKSLFDTDQESHILDFRNPENFFHDVNSVAGLLKQFLRDLPEPLLTSENYSAFIEAAKHDDDIVRRDSMHAIINNLPDPNYATLRALTLHLHRVMENSAVNRMSSQNLAIVFGPTLMGTAPGSNIADASWQVRVVDTILQNTYQIFDED